MYVYVYLKSEASEAGRYTVGFYDPEGDWHSESEHAESEAAAERVNFLNGGADGENVGAILAAICEAADQIARAVRAS